MHLFQARAIVSIFDLAALTLGGSTGIPKMSFPKHCFQRRSGAILTFPRRVRSNNNSSGIDGSSTIPANNSFTIWLY